MITAKKIIEHIEDRVRDLQKWDVSVQEDLANKKRGELNLTKKEKNFLTENLAKNDQRLKENLNLLEWLQLQRSK